MIWISLYLSKFPRQTGQYKWTQENKPMLQCCFHTNFQILIYINVLLPGSYVPVCVDVNTIYNIQYWSDVPTVQANSVVLWQWIVNVSEVSICFTAHSMVIWSLIGWQSHEYLINPEVRRCCCFAVESPLWGWRKTSRYNAATEHLRSGHLNTNHSLSWISNRYQEVLGKNDGGNRQVPSASCQRRDATFGKRASARLRANRPIETITNLLVWFCAFCVLVQLAFYPTASMIGAYFRLYSGWEKR